MSTPMLASFAEPPAVLIQGASRGIGLEFCRQILAGCPSSRVVSTCRSPGEADGLLSLASRFGKRLSVLPLDVTDEDTIRSAAESTRRLCGELNLVVNCAGVLHRPDSMFPERRLEEVDPAHLIESFRVNAAGPLLVAKHFAALLPANGRAVYATISARVGSIGDNRLGGWYGYRASKAAQNMFTRCLSIELVRRHRGLICVGLHPGTTDTGLSKPFQKNVPPTKLFSVERSVDHLLEVIDSLRADDNGSFYAWDGKRIPW